MNILFISPKPPNHLHRMRSLNNLRVLTRDHYVHLVCLMASEDELEHFDPSMVSKFTCVPHPKMKSFANCLVRGVLPEPLEAAYCYSPLMQKIVDKILDEEDIDLIFVMRARMARYGLNAKKKINKVIDLTDSMEMYYRRTAQIVPWYRKLISYEEWFKYRLYERRIVSKFDMCVVTSEIDAKFITDRTKNCKITVLPNVVDMDIYRRETPLENIDETMLLFYGLMTTPANIDAAKFLVEEIFPFIQQNLPKVKLYIVGPKPPRAIVAYGEKDPNIIVTGYVSNLGEYISKSVALLVPIRSGAGTRQKILQAFSIQTPVVSTSLGAEGLDGLSADSIFIEDIPEKFAERVVSLVKNPDLGRQMGLNGQQLVNHNYSIHALRQKLTQMFRESFRHLNV